MGGDGFPLPVLPAFLGFQVWILAHSPKHLSWACWHLRSPDGLPSQLQAPLAVGSQGMALYRAQLRFPVRAAEGNELSPKTADV